MLDKLGLHHMCLRAIAVACVSLIASRSDAQSTEKIRGENPHSTRHVFVLGLSTLPAGQRRVVYVRPDQFPALLVAIHDKDGTADDLAAGYDLAVRLVGPMGLLQKKKDVMSKPVRIVLGPAQVQALSDERRADFARYLELVSRARHMTVPGIGSGPLLAIKKRQ